MLICVRSIPHRVSTCILATRPRSPLPPARSCASTRHRGRSTSRLRTNCRRTLRRRSAEDGLCSVARRPQLYLAATRYFDDRLTAGQIPMGRQPRSNSIPTADSGFFIFMRLIRTTTMVYSNWQRARGSASRGDRTHGTCISIWHISGASISRATSSPLRTSSWTKRTPTFRHVSLPVRLHPSWNRDVLRPYVHRSRNRDTDPL